MHTKNTDSMIGVSMHKFSISLEASHKLLRKLLKLHARPFLSEGLTDAFTHLWMLSSPRQRALMGPPKKVHKDLPIKTEDDRIVASFFV